MDKKAGGSKTETVKTARGSFTFKGGCAKDVSGYEGKDAYKGMDIKATGAAGGYKGSTGGEGVR